MKIKKNGVTMNLTESDINKLRKSVLNEQDEGDINKYRKDNRLFDKVKLDKEIKGKTVTLYMVKPGKPGNERHIRGKITEINDHPEGDSIGITLFMEGNDIYDGEVVIEYDCGEYKFSNQRDRNENPGVSIPPFLFNEQLSKVLEEQFCKSDFTQNQGDNNNTNFA